MKNCLLICSIDRSIDREREREREKERERDRETETERDRDVKKHQGNIVKSMRTNSPHA